MKIINLSIEIIAFALFTSILLFLSPVNIVHAKTFTKTNQNIKTITTTIKDQKDIFITIYNQGIALIKDKRNLAIPKGQLNLEFKGLSAKIIPETALLTASDLKVLEQNFEFDPLTPESLLNKFIGKNIKIVKTNSATGREKILNAKVLSTLSGVVLKLDNGIETGLPGRIIFPYIPNDLKTSPTLIMLIKNKNGKVKDLKLSYLTHGLTWQADYIAKLNKNGLMSLSGWVTLTNTSETDYKNAHLKLVAGDINIIRRQNRAYMKSFQMLSSPRTESEFSRDQLFEYHMYTLKRKTTIKNNQTKQIALLNAYNISYKKEFIVFGHGNNSWYYRRNKNFYGVHLKTGVYLKFKNSKKNHLGIPMPKGIIRVYKEDKNSGLEFAGEDRIDHTSENAVISLKLGNAFDINAIKRQTKFIKLNNTGSNSYKYQSGYEVKITSNKAKPVLVKVVEHIPGQWRIIKENFSHTPKDSNHATWNIPVPAMGTITLKYIVQTK